MSRDIRPDRDGPSHPFWRANLLMLGVVVLLVLLAVLGGGR
jgi:hypothetical protein